MPPKRIPLATYRLQLGSDFTFEQALHLADYLSELGITDCYLSPVFQAAPGSTHGYDTCSFQSLHAELGGENGFYRLANRLRELGMGLLLDFVPNHMAAHPANPWWRDVLQRGRASPFAKWFDIDWHPVNSALHDRVLLPILEDHYVNVLEAGKLAVRPDGDAFALAYHAQRLPLCAESCALLSGSWEAQPLNGNSDGRTPAAQLHSLLQLQHYRLAYWKTGLEELNYRRFFDVPQLVSLRMELPELFQSVHQFVFQLVQQGLITGVRIDHIDGIWAPSAYLQRLQQSFKSLFSAPGTRDSDITAQPGSSGKIPPASAPGVYLVVEKILTGEETLPADWPVDGTTGYDFLNLVNGLFIAATAQAAFDRLYAAFIGASSGYPDCVYQSKKRVLLSSFVSELDALAHRLKHIAGTTRHGLDLTFRQLRAVLLEMIASFPVYRTYVSETDAQLSSLARGQILGAVESARNRNPKLDPQTCLFVQNLLLLQPPQDLDEAGRRRCREFVLRFQQLTAPIMAKGVEDTAFYNFNRLLSLNEVGGDPGNFGVSLHEFHSRNSSQVQHWPHTMLATATHDTKRGEDVRARLNVLSEMPDLWQRAIVRWSHLNAGKKTWLDGRWAPHPNDEYLLYQTLLGAWPAEQNPSPEQIRDFHERLAAYMLKALRESKARTSWLEPNAAYENTVRRFVEQIVSDIQPNPFLDEFKPFQRTVAFFGLFNSLSQTLLKMTCPGVPDFYQGSELWDLSLVDPDNRRPVDYKHRASLLADLKQQTSSEGQDRAALLRTLFQQAQTGQLKLYLIWRSLFFRREHRDTFERGNYLPLVATGSKKHHVCAFARLDEQGCAVVIVPRFVFSLVGGAEIAPVGDAIWGDTTVTVPEVSGHYHNVFTGESISEGCEILLAKALNLFPVALLYSAPR